MRSQRFCPPLLDKNRNYEGIWSNKRKSFVKSLGMNGSNFKNETLFVSFTAIITTRNGWNGTNFYVGNRVVSCIKMSRNRLVNIIVPYGTNVFIKSVRETSVRFTDVKFATFNARNAVNEVGGGACKIVPNHEIGFRSGNRCGRVEERTRARCYTCSFYISFYIL